MEKGGMTVPDVSVGWTIKQKMMLCCSLLYLLYRLDVVKLICSCLLGLFDRPITRHVQPIYCCNLMVHCL